MKLPNGFGSIIRLDGNRRKPYCVKKTIAGKQRIIGYGVDYNDAMAILVDYNKGKTVVNGVTFATLYNLWKKEKFTKVSVSTKTSYEASYKHCESLHDIPITLIKLAELQSIITNIRNKNIGYPTQKKVKVLFMQLYAYAMKHDYADKDYSTYVELDLNNKKKPKTIFITRQLNRISAIIPDMPIARIVPMMCYAGARPSEFINIAVKDVKLRDRYFIIRASKTMAGMNRPVPISKKTLIYFEQLIAEAEKKNSKWLISDEYGERLSYSRFLNVWHKVMGASRCKHTPHECRHTCATWLDNVSANPNSIKRILGHANSDITGGTYTHKSIKELRKAIDKLK